MDKSADEIIVACAMSRWDIVGVSEEMRGVIGLPVKVPSIPFFVIVFAS